MKTKVRKIRNYTFNIRGDFNTLTDLEILNTGGPEPLRLTIGVVLSLLQDMFKIDKEMRGDYCRRVLKLEDTEEE